MVAVRTLRLLTASLVESAEGLGSRSEPLPRGRLVELTRAPDAAATSAAVQICRLAQEAGDPVAWIQPRGGTLFPPDLAEAGIDLEALLVVHVPTLAGRGGIPKAAEIILRAGAFGALVMDVGGVELPRGEAWLGRLAALTREHACHSVFLSDTSARSLGPLVSIRLHAGRLRVRPGRFRLHTDVLKDKSGVRPRLPVPPRFIGPEGMS